MILSSVAEMETRSLEKESEGKREAKERAEKKHFGKIRLGEKKIQKLPGKQNLVLTTPSTMPPKQQAASAASTPARQRTSSPPLSSTASAKRNASGSAASSQSQQINSSQQRGSQQRGGSSQSSQSSKKSLLARKHEQKMKKKKSKAKAKSSQSATGSLASQRDDEDDIDHEWLDAGVEGPRRGETVHSAVRVEDVTIRLGSYVMLKNPDDDGLPFVARVRRLFELESDSMPMLDVRLDLSRASCWFCCLLSIVCLLVVDCMLPFSSSCSCCFSFCACSSSSSCFFLCLSLHFLSSFLLSFSLLFTCHSSS